MRAARLRPEELQEISGASWQCREANYAPTLLPSKGLTALGISSALFPRLLHHGPLQTAMHALQEEYGPHPPRAPEAYLCPLPDARFRQADHRSGLQEAVRHRASAVRAELFLSRHQGRVSALRRLNRAAGRSVQEGCQRDE